jgi:hypothetical protein
MDAVRHRMLVMGGVSNITGQEFTDVWALTLDGTPSWQLLAPGGDAPASMLGWDASADPAHDRVVALAGDGAAAWLLPLGASAAWTRIGVTSPPPFQARHGATYDADRERFVMFGASSLGQDDDVTYQLSLAGAPSWAVLATSTFRPMARGGYGVVADTRRNRMVLFGGCDGDRYFPDAWALAFADATTSASLSLLSADVVGGEAELVWQGSIADGERIVLERSEAGGTWLTRASLVPDGSGYLRYADHEVAAGVRYGYRLRVSSAAGERVTAEIWVQIPGSGTLALAPEGGNPLRGALRFGITLPESAPARIEIVDASGRRVAARDLTGLGAGRHSVRLDPERPPGPGVYLVRLTQGGRAASYKATLVR